MGTRNLTMVISGGKTKVAQYGQWDGYPEGQGKTALEFLRVTNLDAFKRKVDACRFGSKEEISAVYAPFSHGGWMSLEQSEAFSRSPFGYLSRDLGAQILERILQSSNGLMLADHSDFAADSLYCEWAYVIDLDQRTFEVYRGFNHEPPPETERFASLPPVHHLVTAKPYYPVKHLVSFNIDALPCFEEFEKAIEEASNAQDAHASELVNQLQNLTAELQGVSS